MKIVSLNAWGGTAGTKGLMKFFKAHKDVDIFCLQEVFNGGEDEKQKMDEEAAKKEYQLFRNIDTTLVGHSGFFRSHAGENYGLAMFIKKNLFVLEEGEHFVYKYKGFYSIDNRGFNARNIQYIKIKHRGKDLYVINFHGLWNGQGKGDSEDRIEQSKRILDFTKNISGDYILCGDFNLVPESESLKLIENSGLRNLINEYGITSTRTTHYKKPIKFADYAFTTEGIAVLDFKVLPDEVSDHAPLYLEIE